MLLKPYFRTTICNKDISLFTIRHKNGMCCETTNYGATIVSLWVPDKEGAMTDIVLGFNNINDYLTPKQPFGAVHIEYYNRYKNRQSEYNSFTAKEWDVVDLKQNKIVLHCLHICEKSENKIDTLATYELTDNKELRVLFELRKDDAEIVNIYSKSFFNLKGAGLIHNHLLQIKSDKTQYNDKLNVPTCDFTKTDTHNCDFGQLTKIGERTSNPYFSAIRGINEYCILKDFNKNSDSCFFAAHLKEPASGRNMEIYTNQPCIHAYSGNDIENNIGKYGDTYKSHSAICLEPQNIEENTHGFSPSTFQKGNKFKSETFYKFYND